MKRHNYSFQALKICEHIGSISFFVCESVF
jgi:hypothetical protein